MGNEFWFPGNGEREERRIRRKKGAGEEVGARMEKIARCFCVILALSRLYPRMLRFTPAINASIFFFFSLIMSIYEMAQVVGL